MYYVPCTNNNVRSIEFWISTKVVCKHIKCTDLSVHQVKMNLYGSVHAIINL